MSNIKLNEYVRTKQGYIAKLIKIDNIGGFLTFDRPIYKKNYKPTTLIDFKKFNNLYYKSSENLIDLIEIGDIVNGNFATKEISNIEIKSILTKEKIEKDTVLF